MDYSQILEKAAAYTQKFVDAAIPVAQKAYEIGLKTIQIDGIQSLIVGFIWLVIAITCGVFAKKTWNTINKLENEHKNVDDGYFAFFTSCIVLLVISTVISAIWLLDIWTWIKVFQPDLWLAKQAVNAVISAAK